MDHCVNEEEKKDAQEVGEQYIGVGGSDVEIKATTDDVDDDDDQSEELEDLPEEITGKIGSYFKSEEELELALVEAGVGDLPVILLNGKPRLVVPSTQHNEFTGNSIYNFVDWAKNRWGYASSTRKVRLSNGKSRDPDLSFWGYPRCYRDKKGKLRPIDGHKDCVPDVVIQFSWKNKKLYEENAIDDIMNRSLEMINGVVSTSLPNLGYLIKVRFSKKRKMESGLTTQDIVGLDIYRLSHGTTIADALDPNNPNASHCFYEPGGPEHFITITPADLGITGFWAWLCGEYRLKASEILEEMQNYQKSHQMDGIP